MTVSPLANASQEVHARAMMYWHDYDGMGLFAGVMMLIFWIIIIALGVLVVRWVLSNRGSSSASAILDERLARGEISVAEYHERKSALQQRKR